MWICGVGARPGPRQPICDPNGGCDRRRQPVGTPAKAAGAGGRRARPVRAANGAGAGAVPRRLRPYLPAAGSTLKSSGTAGGYRKICEVLLLSD
jgi:hypothetical protein